MDKELWYKRSAIIMHYRVGMACDQKQLSKYIYTSLGVTKCAVYWYLFFHNSFILHSSIQQTVFGYFDLYFYNYVPFHVSWKIHRK